jgi:hydroxymethylbilane synthase
VAVRLRIGTRKSAMALAQTEEIARRLTAAEPGIEVEIVKFETTGDQDQTSTPRCIRSRTCRAMKTRRAS